MAKRGRKKKEDTMETPEMKEEKAPALQKPKLESRDRVQNRRRAQIKYRNFDEFWFKIKKDRNFIDDRYKKPLVAHLKARGFWSPEKYEEGLKDFGL